MILKCQKETRTLLLKHLQEEAIYNTFLTADILNYGFEQEFQEVHIHVEEEIKGVYLKFFNNLMIYSQTEEVDDEFLRSYLGEWSPAVIMGKASVISRAASLLPSYTYCQKTIYTVSKQRLCRPAETNVTVHTARLRDVDRIYQFLLSIDEIKEFYGSKDMIVNRIKTGDGVHCFAEKDGEIISHANSTADNPHTVMIGGVATKREERNQGIAAVIVHELTTSILTQGKTPCLFAKEEKHRNLFIELGFERFGSWGTLVRRMA